MNVLPSDRRSPLGIFPGQSALRLYDCVVVEALRNGHYSRRTEEATGFAASSRLTATHLLEDGYDSEPFRNFGTQGVQTTMVYTR